MKLSKLLSISILIASALLLSDVKSGNAQSPKHHQIEKTGQHTPLQNSPANTSNDQRGTEKMPLAIKLLNTGKSQEETAKESAQVQRQNSAEWWMRVLTGALVGVGVLQLIAFVIQAYVLHRTFGVMERANLYTRAALKAATRNAKAAEQQAVVSENAFIETQRVNAIAQRAYLYLSEVRITFNEAGNVYVDSTQYDYEIVYPICNGGPTPALYIGAFERAIVSKRPPVDISAAAKALDRPQNAVIPPLSPQPLNGKFRSFVSKNELDDLRAGKRKLFFYGVLTYNDIFDKERHTWFTLSFTGTPAEAGKSRPMAFETAKGFNRFD